MTLMDPVRLNKAARHRLEFRLGGIGAHLPELRRQGLQAPAQRQLCCSNFARPTVNSGSGRVHGRPAVDAQFLPPGLSGIQTPARAKGLSDWVGMS